MGVRLCEILFALVPEFDRLVFAGRCACGCEFLTIGGCNEGLAKNLRGLRPGLSNSEEFEARRVCGHVVTTFSSIFLGVVVDN